MPNDFTATYDLHQEAILRYCTWESRDSEVGEDLMQETFLRFWLCLERKKEIMHERAFLYRIAHNLFINHVRKKKESSLDAMMETGFDPGIDTWHQTHSRLDAEKPLEELKKMPSPTGKRSTGGSCSGCRLPRLPRSRARARTEYQSAFPEDSDICETVSRHRYERR